MASSHEISKLILDTQNSILSNSWRPFVSKLNSLKPLGLDFSDIYHSTVLPSRGIHLSNSSILELGGALPPSYVFDYLQVKSWYSVEYHQYDDNQFPSGDFSSLDTFPHYSYTSAGWESFVNERSDLIGSFDYIYSISAFEHIYDLKNCLLRILPFVRKGGCIYSYFTPIWSAPNGSHGFLPPQLKSLGDHAHLLFDFQELVCFLRARFNFSALDAIDVSHNLYRSNQLNRYSYEDFMLIFESLRHKFSSVFCQPIGLSRFSDLYPLATLERIHRFYPSMIYSAAGFELILRV